SSQGLEAARQPALTPTANPPLSVRAINRRPGGPARSSAGIGPRDALSTTTISHGAERNSGSSRSQPTSRTAAGPDSSLTMMIVRRGRDSDPSLSRDRFTGIFTGYHHYPRLRQNN